MGFCSQNMYMANNYGLIKGHCMRDCMSMKQIKMWKFPKHILLFLISKYKMLTLDTSLVISNSKSPKKRIILF